MAFKVKEINEVSELVEVEERLWLTADDKVVADGDPSAASLLASEGTQLTREDAERYGLVKSRKPSENKMAAPSENKEKAADLIARMGDMSEAELEELRQDERKSVVEKAQAELKRRESE